MYPSSSAGSSTVYSYTSAKSHTSSQQPSPTWSVGSFDSSSSPATSTTAVSRGSAPGAPYLGPVPLPPTSSQAGLITPPDSPNRSRGPTAIAIHPILCYHQSPLLMYNVLYSVSHVQLRPPYNANTLREPATHPLLTRVHVDIPQFPNWSFVVENPHGVTVIDVLQKIEQALYAAVGRSEWEKQAKGARDVAAASFNARTGGNEGARQAGIKRVDFLGSHVLFAGLTHSTRVAGHWDLHFTSLPH